MRITFLGLGGTDLRVARTLPGSDPAVAGGNQAAGFAAVVALLAACSSNPPPALPAPQPVEPEPESPAFYEEGLASWYGPGFEGRPTASGEPFDADSLTAAHKDLPFGSLVRVINVDNGREVVVRINDRGPFVEERIIDLSRAAARALGMVRAGLARVRLVLERLGPPHDARRESAI